jgi:23S rRNA (adenine2503-C2)-methyltransferase
MNIKNIDKILEKEPAFRKKQVLQFVFKGLGEKWDDCTVLSKPLREELAQRASLDIKAETSFSKDKKTIKSLITLGDDQKVETVLMRHGSRNTVCVSSQVGCPLGCLFCATGEMGFVRDLNSFEILEQVLFFERYLAGRNEKVTNVVFMGMGEPFLNLKNVFGAIDILNDENYFFMSARNISISTIGLPHSIYRLTEYNRQINLAVSLHSANDVLRNEIMPATKNFPIADLMSDIAQHIDGSGRKVMFEYLLIKGVNDSQDQARELVRLFRKKRLYLVNLIKYNSTGKYEPSDREAIFKFKKILEESKVHFTERFRYGSDIEGACGQLASNKK